MPTHHRVSTLRFCIKVIKVASHDLQRQFFSRKGAKTQRKTGATRQRFASLREKSSALQVITVTSTPLA
jgi:hypothetical protein